MPFISSGKSSVSFSSHSSRSTIRLQVLAMVLLVTVALPAAVGAAPIRRKDVPRITLANLSPPFTDYDYFQHCEAFPFAPEAATFSPVNAWWLAEIATLVYADETYSRTRMRAAGFRQILFFDRAGTHAVIAANDRFAVIAFRGSEIWKRSDRFDPQHVFADFRTNIDIRLADWEGGGSVHRGFKEALGAVWGEMAPVIERLQGHGLTIWLTGHSLGAALATLAADRLQDVQGLYTFGSPRVGDTAFGEHFHLPAFRVVNGDDIVASVPAKIPFRHVGTLIAIDARGCLRSGDGSLTAGPGSEACVEDARAAPPEQAGLGIDPADLIPDAIRDHVPLLYSVYLWNALVDHQTSDEGK